MCERGIADDGTLQRLLDYGQRLSWAALYSLLGIFRNGPERRSLGSVVEVVRIQDPGITFDFDVRGFAEFYGMEISRIAVDHLLPPE